MKKFIMAIFCFTFFYAIFANTIIDEYKLKNCNILLEEIEYRNLYKISVFNSKGELIKSMDPFYCHNRGWIQYLGQNYFSIYGGSFQAPDCFCYIYDANTNRLSEKIFLPVCFDLKNELVLTAEEDITVSRIFNPEEKIIITPPSDICSFIQLWDRIRINDTSLENGRLYLSYNVFRDNQTLETYGRTEEFSLTNLLLQEEPYTEVVSENETNKRESKKIIMIIITFLIFGVMIGYLLGKGKLCLSKK